MAAHHSQSVHSMLAELGYPPSHKSHYMAPIHPGTNVVDMGLSHMTDFLQAPMTDHKDHQKPPLGLFF